MTITETKPLNVEIFELMGWEKIKHKGSVVIGTHSFEVIDCWRRPKSSVPYAMEDLLAEAPAIHENFQLTLDWLVPEMRKRGWGYFILEQLVDIHDTKVFRFGWDRPDSLPSFAEIINDNVALAACLAALTILKELAKEGK